MFVGHYAAAFALKAVDKRVSLGTLFVAVQFLDFVFFPLTLLGIERFAIVENYTQATHFHLLYMPYSHTLLAAVIWSLLIYGCLRKLMRPDQAGIALVVALAVASHWPLDFVAHKPDLRLFPGSELVVGLGLWMNAGLTLVVECGLLLGGLYWYLRRVPERSVLASYGLPLFVLVLLGIEAATIYGGLPAGVDTTFTAIVLLLCFATFAAIAALLDSN